VPGVWRHSALARSNSSTHHLYGLARACSCLML